MPVLPDRSAIAARLFADETTTVRALAAEAMLNADEQRRVAELARQLVAAVRAGRTKQGGIDAFMQEYSLSSEEGVVLMCLAEALLRIPDADTADRLIADKVGGKDWERHLGQSESLFVNASAWGLMLTGRFVDLGRIARSDVGGYLKKLVTRSGEPIIRNAMRQAMRIMGKQFVLGGRSTRHCRSRRRSRRTDIASPMTCWVRPPSPWRTRTATSRLTRMR